MGTEFDNEIIKELKNEIANGEVSLYNDTSLIIESIEKKFPFVYSGIDWTKVNTIYFIDLKEKKTEDKYITVKKILEEIFLNYLDLSNERVIVVGDYETDMGYEMYYSTFLKKHQLFFDLPQDTYVWFPKIEKCINYTFEDELYFG